MHICLQILTWYFIPLSWVVCFLCLWWKTYKGKCVAVKCPVQWEINYSRKCHNKVTSFWEYEHYSLICPYFFWRWHSCLDRREEEARRKWVWERSQKTDVPRDIHINSLRCADPADLDNVLTLLGHEKDLRYVFLNAIKKSLIVSFKL